MKQFNIELEKFISVYNQGYTYDKIGEFFNADRHTISKYVKRNNLKRKKPSSGRFFKHSYDRSFFDIIDSKEKAYFLGLLYADGCNTGNGLQITLSESDKNILEKIKNLINFTGSIYYRIGKTLNFKDKIYNCSNYYCLQITSVNISKQLSNLGCVPKKSLVLRFPPEEILSKQFYNHFIRGYFDGDGCIYHHKTKNRFSFCLTSTKQFLEKVQEILMKECNLGKTKILPINKKNTETRELRYSGRLQCIKIMEYLYKDSNDLFIERKYNKFKLTKDGRK